MIKKIIACADIHIPAFKGIENLNVILDKFVDECEKVVKDEGSPDNVRVVIAGDLFNNKISITNESILAANRFLSKLDGICKTIVIAGNHDLLVNNMDRIDSISSLTEIGNYENVVFLDKELGYKSGCWVDDNVVWGLYSSFDDFNSPELKSERIKHPDKICIGLVHGDVNGAVTATGFQTENGLNPDVFEGCDFVIAGHIHKQQEIRKNGIRIVYCSSLKQKDFGETILGHGYVIWDISNQKNITYDFVDIPNDESSYYIFSIDNESDIDEDDEKLINL